MKFVFFSKRHRILCPTSTEVHQQTNGYMMDRMEFGQGWPFDRQHVFSLLFQTFSWFCVSISAAYLLTTYSPKPGGRRPVPDDVLHLASINTLLTRDDTSFNTKAGLMFTKAKITSICNRPLAWPDIFSSIARVGSAIDPPCNKHMGTGFCGSFQPSQAEQ